MIGVFDSGLGGLTVVQRLRERLPRADVLFFADQAHVPYGDREPDDLYRLLRANLAWLDERGVSAIAVGCNTSCAIARRRGWPATRAPVLDLIDAAAAAVRRAGYRRIGVIATAATVRAGAYGDALREAVPGARVWEVAAPALVPIVEAGECAGERARDAVASACAQLPAGLDALAYGCTHYPLLGQHFAAVMGEGVALVDPAVTQAERAAAFAIERGLGEESGATRYITSGDADAFARSVDRIMRASSLVP